MSNRIEWAHENGGFSILTPDEVEEISPDGNEMRDWGIALGGDGAVVLYGQPAQLRTLLLQASNALPMQEREYDREGVYDANRLGR